MERRAVLLQEDVLRTRILAVLVGKQNWRDGPIVAETMLFLLHKRMKEPFLEDVSEMQKGKLV